VKMMAVIFFEAERNGTVIFGRGEK
jgi:hypothetical protein